MSTVYSPPARDDDRDRVAAVGLARLDLRTAALVVDVPSDLAGGLRHLGPLPRPRHGAVRLDVTGDDDRRAAIALLRWRSEVERFASQYRNASP
jgi:hypothetical protein